MQRGWRKDTDKLTFIACLPTIEEVASKAHAGLVDASERMIGDVNLFLFPADEDPEGCIGELERKFFKSPIVEPRKLQNELCCRRKFVVMIARSTMRKQGYGRATILTFLHYIHTHLDEILSEYRKGQGADKMTLLQLKVKIGSKNEKRCASYSRFPNHLLMIAVSNSSKVLISSKLAKVQTILESSNLYSKDTLEKKEQRAYSRNTASRIIAKLGISRSILKLRIRPLER